MILVTGVTGKTGGATLQHLVAGKTPARAAYRDLAKAAKQPGIEPVLFDFDKPETMAAALKGVTKLFLVHTGPKQVEQEIRAAEEAKKAGVRHIVKLSVWDADKEAYQFAKHHRVIEKAIEGLGVPYTFLRPTGFMQNLLASAGTIKQGALYMPLGDAKIGHIDASDIGATAAKILSAGGHEGKAYNLSGPQALSYGDVAATLTMVLGKPVKYVNVPMEDWKKTLLGYGMPPPVVEGMADLMRYYATAGSDLVSDAVEKIVGKKPKTLEAFVREHRSAFV